MKTGIITGCSRGIGLATAKLLLADKKTRILGTSTSGNSPIENPNFSCYPLDLSDTASISNFMHSLADTKIDFLINNAGILLENSTSEVIDLKHLRKTFEVNLFGTITLTEGIIPKIKNNGKIISISSDWGSFSEANFDAYHPSYKMSKSALNMYTKLLAERCESMHIYVSSLDPGWTQTEMGGYDAPRTAKEVALDVKHLLSNDLVSGKFWHRGKIRKW